MPSVSITFNGQPLMVEAGKSLLSVCMEQKLDIPQLCYHADLAPSGRCRMCVVDVGGRIMTSCDTLVKEGMVIQTDTPDIQKARKLNLELILSRSPAILDEKDTELVRLAKRLGIKKSDLRFKPYDPKTPDTSCSSLCIDRTLCILCNRCVQKCQEVQGVYAIGMSGRSADSQVCPVFSHPMSEINCVFCGQCSLVCPSGAIKEAEYVEEVKKAIADPDKFVIVQTAPSVRATIAETQGHPAGTVMTGKMVAGLRRLGFDRVLDTNFAADLTIIEEGHELIERITNKGVLPLITSCSPGWVKYIEHFYPELLPHLSSCKSPQQMFGAIAKTYYAKKNGIDPKKMVVVSIMPCTAKKYESRRPEMKASGMRDVDYALTTRELGKWFNESGIRLAELPDEHFDPVMGDSSGAGAIFGTTGGVMEASLRYAADILEKKDLPKLEYTQVRGLEGIREATVPIGKLKLSAAVAHGLGNAHILLERVKAEPSRYHFIEIMACPGGCIGGGGAPMPTTKEIIKARQMGLYKTDASLPIRKSHHNPEIKALYENFLGEPGGKKAHELLHTHYNKRTRFGN